VNSAVWISVECYSPGEVSPKALTMREACPARNKAICFKQISRQLQDIGVDRHAVRSQCASPQGVSSTNAVAAASKATLQTNGNISTVGGNVKKTTLMVCRRVAEVPASTWVPV
jgi:hypothetical protein